MVLNVYSVRSKTRKTPARQAGNRLGRSKEKAFFLKKRSKKLLFCLAASEPDRFYHNPKG